MFYLRNLAKRGTERLADIFVVTSNAWLILPKYKRCYSYEKTDRRWVIYMLYANWTLQIKKKKVLFVLLKIKEKIAGQAI